MHLCRSSSTVPRLPSFLEMLQNPHVWLIPCLNVQKWTERGVLSKCSISQFPEVLRSYGAFTIFTSKRASRHSGVHFLNSSTSKSAPTMRCFGHCTSKCASRHTSVHFFGNPTFKSATMSLIQPDGSAPAALASLLLRWLWTMEKHRVSRLYLPAHLHLLSFLWSSFFSSSLLWLFPPLLFHLSILSEVWLLNFLRKPQWFVISNESISWDIASIAKGLFWFSGTTVWTKATQERWQAQSTWLLCCLAPV